MQHRLLLSQEEKSERIRNSKREYMRKQREKKKFSLLPAPVLTVHSKCPPTNEQKIVRRQIQNRLAQQRRRDKQRLLYPVYHLCDPQDMSMFKSWFALHAGNYEYVLHLAPWELYSTKLGCIYLHGRHVLDETGVKGPTFLPSKEDYDIDDAHWIEIPPDTTQFLDCKNDLLHVVRNGSPILEILSESDTANDFPYKKGFLDINFSIIVNGLLLHGLGTGDEVRSPDSRRLSFGWNEFGTPTAFGIVDRTLKSNARAFKKEIGRIAEFLCASMYGMEAASGNQPLWWDHSRDAGYAAKLRKKLHLPQHSPMRAEMVVVSLMPLTQFRPKNKEHLDVKNPNGPGYNRNGTFSAVVRADDKHLYLLQVLVASRRYGATLGLRGLR